MNPNKDFYYKIEAYLCNGLSLSEKKALENAIATDSQLKKQVEMQRLEWDGMESLVETDLRHKMDAWDAEMPFEMPNWAVVKPITAHEETKIVLMRSNYRWSIAASLVLAMGALVWLWQSQHHLDTPIAHIEPPKSTEFPVELPKSPVESPKLPVELPKTLPTSPTTAQVKPVLPTTSLKKPSVQPPKQVETTPQVVQVTPEPIITPSRLQMPISNTQDYTVLAETNYEKEVFKLTERTRGTDIDTPLTPAEKAFQQSDFKQVISLLNVTPIEKKYVAELNLLAHAYFQEKQFANAQPLFEKMVDWSRLLARREAEWYLLLTYLAQCPTLQTQFDALAAQIKANLQHEYYSKTVALLENLPKK